MAGLTRNKATEDEKTTAPEPAKVEEAAPATLTEDEYAAERYAVAAPGVVSDADKPEVDEDESDEDKAARQEKAAIWNAGWAAHEGVQFGVKTDNPYADPVEEGTSQGWTVQQIDELRTPEAAKAEDDAKDSDKE